MNKKNYLGYIQVLASAVIFGAQSIIVRAVQGYGIDTMQFQLIRSFMAFVILTVVFGRTEEFSGRIAKKDLGIAAVLSLLGFALTSFFLFISYGYIGPGAATGLHFTYPVLVTFMSAVFFRDKIKGSEIICLCICMAGVALLYEPGERSVKGTLIALASGLVYAFYSLFLEKTGILSRVGSIRLSRYMYIVSSVIFLAMCIATGNLDFRHPFMGYVLCLVMAIVANILAAVMYQNGVKLIGSKSTTILSTAEPVVALIVGVLVFGSALTAKSVFGSVFIIASTILLVVLKSRRQG